MPAPAWTDALLTAARFEADPPADRVVEAIYALGDPRAVHAVNLHLMDPSRPGLPPLAPAVQSLLDDYLAQTAALPSWADQDQIETCEEFFSEHGMLSSAILCCASLPECYLDASDAPVLVSTTQLVDHVERRIFETSHMIVTAMQPGGMKPGGPGVRSTQRVRLMHAAVRRLLTDQVAAAAAGKPGRDGQPMKPLWNPAAGVPVSQEAMAFVILTFSWVGLRSLMRLGVETPPEVQDAYIHTWSVIGHVIGVREDLLVHTVADAQALFEAIKARKRGASPAGQALTASLMGWMEHVLPSALKPLPREMLVQLMGEDDSRLLGVELTGKLHEEEAFWEGLVHSLVDLVKPLLHKPAGQRMAQALFHLLTQRLWSRHADWNQEAFGLPPALQQAWRVAPP